MKTLLLNIKGLGGILPDTTRLLRGAAMNKFSILENAYLEITDSLISGFGSMNELQEQNADVIKDLTGKYVLPAWCDSHTHLVFAKWREGEFMDKLKGMSYKEIAKRGGGILASAKVLHDTDESLLIESALERIEEIKSTGTGAVEIKSGYGLSVAGELKMLRVIKRLKEQTNLDIKATFLGAHSYPMEYRANHEGYLTMIENEMLPIIAEEQLADYIDVFCEDGFFSADETARLLESGQKFGLQPKIHANELNFSGGIEVGVKFGALSVDHLECTAAEQIQLLKSSDTMATVLPTTAFFLKLPYAHARQMIDGGVALALATDYNPGSSPSGNFPFVISLACMNMKLTTLEALNASTINGAYAMGVEEQLGSLAIGKKANLIITKPMPSLDFIPYRFGTNWVEKTVIGAM
jgi:imidazolonepropionase